MASTVVAEPSAETHEVAAKLKDKADIDMASVGGSGEAEEEQMLRATRQGDKLHFLPVCPRSISLPSSRVLLCRFEPAI
jgi:hypothetical protein